MNYKAPLSVTLLYNKTVLSLRSQRTTMKSSAGLLCLIPLIAVITSCHTLNSSQTSVVKKFAATSRDVSDLPYNILYNYYTIEFKRNQLTPENYVTGNLEQEELDQLAENVISKIEGIRKDYYEGLKTAGQVKTMYELLQTYINSLEKLSDDKYASDLEKKTAEMGNKMNTLVSKFNTSPDKKVNLPINPGQWLTALLTVHGRIKLKTQQASLLRDYITQADTLVQAINQNFQEYLGPYLSSELQFTQRKIRDQFKRSISPYLQYLNRHPDSATSIVAIEFYSRIIPVYYDLTDEIHKNQLLIERTDSLMNYLANTHKLMKSMFNAEKSVESVLEQINNLKENISVIKNLFGKEGQEKFSFYKTFILQDENTFSDIINKR